MQTGWLKTGGKWYYLNSSGAMTTGWQKVSGKYCKYYYMNASGVMQAKRWIGDYYVGASGVMATNQWVGNYYVGSDGKWIKNYGKTSVVYWTPGGEVYHKTKSCPSLSRSKTIKSGSVSQAKSAGKVTACRNCY